MIYTKTNSHHPFFKKKFFSNLTNARLEPNSIYWYDQHDAATRATPFNKFIDQPHWEHLEKDPTSKILMFYGDEYFNIIDIEDWVSTMKKWKVDPSKLYIICMDKNWIRWASEEFRKRDFHGVNLQDLNLLMVRVEEQPEQLIKKRFSALSRNYSRWRLSLYTKLREKQLLEHFNFTFNNINPYFTEIKIFSEKDILNDLQKLKFDITPDILDWVKGMPYTLQNSSVRVKLAKEAYDMISTAGINIIVESHFDPYWNFSGHRRIPVLEFSPTFPTEKTYKPIACRRAFIVFSTPYFLKEFRDLGYKTFNPYIDESYDEIEDNNLRLHAIVNEIERLSNLSQDEFNNVINNCREITDHNFLIMQQNKNKFVLEEKFNFLLPYIDMLEYFPK